jgi:hypothetical protein
VRPASRFRVAIEHFHSAADCTPGDAAAQRTIAHEAEYLAEQPPLGRAMRDVEQQVDCDVDV